jgi:hypothetical protein
LKHRIGASVVRNSKTGKTYLKLVNALPCELHLTVYGLTIPATAKTEGFEGKPEDLHLEMKRSEVGSVIILPPYSFRSIEL